MSAAAKSNQEKIAYLKRYVRLDREIQRKLEESQRWRGRLGRITSRLNPEISGGGPKITEADIIAKIIDLEREMDEGIDRLILIRRGVSDCIEAVQDDRERQLLQYRYLDGLTWERIAVEMNYSWRQVHRIHSDALRSVRITPCRGECEIMA